MPDRPAGKDRKLTPEEIADIDAARYDEPGRELRTTKPVDPDAGGSGGNFGAGAGGDVDNPTAKVETKKPPPADKDDVTTDERNRLAHGRGA